MGQKINPITMRLGVIKQPDSVWYANKKGYANYLLNDIHVREFLRKRLKGAGVSNIAIERLANNARVRILSSRPGVIIGKKGNDIETLRKEISHLMGISVYLTIEEVRKPDLNARLVAESIAQQLENRVMFRRAMKRAVQNAQRAGAKGVKICVAGRLGGAEIARSEWHREGRVPLHTFRADIDYGVARAKTTYGIIGVKVWIYKGEVFEIKGANAQEGEAS